MTDWTSLIAALDEWQAEGRVAQFWLRDDDAVEPTPALTRLLELGLRHRVPLTLAVIPAHVVEGLVAELASRDEVSVALHGWSHTNHAGAGEKKQELGAHRPAETVLGELSAGFTRLQSMFGARFSPVLVPPWNRIDKALIPHLADLGLTTLSVFGPEKPGVLPQLNTHADIMHWHGTRGCRPADDIIADIIKRMNDIRITGGAMGLLTHHLVHDDAAWQFIDGLLSATAGHPACQWSGLPDLIGA